MQKSIDSIRKRKFVYIINYLIHGKSYKKNLNSFFFSVQKTSIEFVYI